MRNISRASDADLCVRDGEGAPAGEYNVVITWFPPNTGEVGNPINKLPAKYADQQTPLLKATVKEENNELPPYKLAP